MSKRTAPQEIWLQLFQRFIDAGVHCLDDLAKLNTFSRMLLRTLPGTEALWPRLQTTCAVCHVKLRFDAQLYEVDVGSGVTLCGACKDRVEALTAQATAQNPEHPECADAFYVPLRVVN